MYKCTKTENNYQHELPITIGTDIFIVECFGIPYTLDEFDKCCGYKVTGIHIHENRVSFDVKKGKSAEINRIPLEHLGKLYFTNAESAKCAIAKLLKN